MSAFRFIGSESVIGYAGHPTDHQETKLTRFGQSIDLEDSKAECVIAGGCALLPEANFDKISFTEQEVSIYAYPGQRVVAPDAFMVKYREALKDFAGLKAFIEAGGKLAEFRGEA